VHFATAPLHAPVHGASFHSALGFGSTTTLLPGLTPNVEWQVPVHLTSGSFETFTDPEPATESVSSTVGAAAFAPETIRAAATPRASRKRCPTDTR
jgi:hypothetical protein